MTTWEYKQVALDMVEMIDGSTEGRLNELGAAGWELVSALQREKHGYSQEVCLIFKRARPSPGAP